MLDRISLLFRFQTMAEVGSLTRAAELLCVTQPALSRSLSQLEAHYGHRLLVRHARGVEPTAFGMRLLSTISRLARDWELIEADLDGNAADSGKLRIEAGPLWSAAILPCVIPRLHRKFPNLLLEVTPSDGDSLTMLLSGKIDISFGGLHAGAKATDQLESRAFTTVTDRVVARVDHPIHKCGPHDYRAAQDYPWIIYAIDPIYEADTLHAVFERTGLPPRVGVRTKSLLAVLRLLQEGDYLCLLPDAAVHSTPGNRIKTTPLELGRRSSQSGALYRQAVANHPPLRALLDLCQDHFARTPL